MWTVAGSNKQGCGLLAADKLLCPCLPLRDQRQALDWVGKMFSACGSFCPAGFQSSWNSRKP